ncbi:MAG: glycosyltransferase [Elusimicrobia bacterium]|nr:glycosyltransferase [Elusimicrobiota bacterium]
MGIRVLSVAPRMIYPAYSGGDLRILSLLRHLKTRYRFSLLIPVVPDQQDGYSKAAAALEREGVCKVHLVARDPSPPRQPPWRLPDGARDFYDRRLAESLVRIVIREDIPIVHFEFSEMAQYAKTIRFMSRAVLTEHDASLVSAFRFYRPSRSLWEQSWSWLRRLAYERAVLGDCHKVIALSEADAGRLRRLSPRSDVAVIPQGVDLGDFPFRAMAERAPNTLLFIGYFGHHPNEEAALEIGQKIMPWVLRAIPRARAWIVGSKPGPRVLSLESSHIRVLGSVPRVQPFLQSGRAFVAPLRRGYGSKTKILEAFASGIPVVATPLACEAMPGIEAGKHLLIGSRHEEIARQAVRLLRDPELGRRLADNARRYVEREWDWAARAQALDQVYREVLKKPAVIPS